MNKKKITLFINRDMINYRNGPHEFSGKYISILLESKYFNKFSKIV